MTRIIENLHLILAGWLTISLAIALILGPAFKWGGE